MPIFPGEERLVTLFTDCHYYFAQPTARPVLHRFDKASYFYIYWNSTRQTSRIEVANNAGTADQDAFHGHLDGCRIINSYKFPTLVTLVVDDIGGAPTAGHARSSRDSEEWLLPSADPRDANKMLYRLHTIDFYFWTQEDAKSAVSLLKKLLNPGQLDLVELRQSEQPQQQGQQQQQNRQSTGSGVSSVVQNLEQIAITDPAYGNGQTRNSQNQPQSQQMILPPPPPPPPLSQAPSNIRSATASSLASQSPISQTSQVDSRKSPQPEKPAMDFTPMAYNPAAPAAPEKIAHREKTPPPEDGEQGTGLAAAAVHDQIPSASGYKPSQAWGAPPTTSRVGQSSQWGSPPPPSATSGYGPQMSSSVGYASPQASSAQYQQNQSSTASAVPSFGSPPTGLSSSQDLHRHSVAAEMYTPDLQGSPNQVVETPGTQFYSSVQQPSKPLQHVQPQYADYLAAGTKPGQQPPPGGWAQYSYARGGHHSHDGGMNYEIHNQVYRPTDQEANPHKSKPSRAEAELLNTRAGKKGRAFLAKLSAKAQNTL